MLPLPDPTPDPPLALPDSRLPPSPPTHPPRSGAQELLLKKLVETHYDAKQEIIKEGANNNTFYVIKTGEAAVIKAGATVNTLKSGRSLTQLTH